VRGVGGGDSGGHVEDVEDTSGLILLLFLQKQNLVCMRGGWRLTGEEKCEPNPKPRPKPEPAPQMSVEEA